MKFLANLFRTAPSEPLPASDQLRLRDLEKNFDILASDVDRCITEIPKIHAKLRMRATRALEKAQEDDEEVPTNTAPPVLGKFTKDDLRQFARQKGLRA